MIFELLENRDRENYLINVYPIAKEFFFGSDITKRCFYISTIPRYQIKQKTILTMYSSHFGVFNSLKKQKLKTSAWPFSEILKKNYFV